jgi:hypothetical protein
MTTIDPPTLPSTAEDITADWLGTVLGARVDDVEVIQIGAGIGVSSALYRCTLRGQGCPDHVVVKLPALDPAAVFTSTVLRMYIREAGFFARLAEDCPVRVPSGYHAAVDPDSSAFVVVMEDLCGLRAVDQVEGMGIGDAARAVDALACWQARWWDDAERLVVDGVAMSLGDPIYPAVLPTVFAEGWEKVTGTGDIALAPAVREIGERFTEAIPGLLTALAEGPATLLHGDFRADNMLFDGDELVLLDFQLIGAGRGAYDLAYFVTQSLDPAVASQHEQDLFDRWIDGLSHNGVSSADRAQCWLDYRRAALFCLTYPVVASRGMDLDDPRQLGLVRTMMDRYGRAAEELALVRLLEAG